MNHISKTVCILAFAATGTAAYADPKPFPLPPQPAATLVCQTRGSVEFYEAKVIARRPLAKGTKIAYSINVAPNGPVKGEIVLKLGILPGVAIALPGGAGQGKGCTARIAP